MKNLTLAIKEKTYIIPEHIAKNLSIATGSKYVLDKTEIFLESSRLKLEDLIEVCIFEDEELEKIYCGEDLDLYEVLSSTELKNVLTVLIKRKEDNKIFFGSYSVKNGIIFSSLFKEVKSA